MIRKVYHPIKPLVIGPGRGGFTMCIHILHQFVRLFPNKRDLRQIILDSFLRDMEDYIPHRIKSKFLEYGINEDLIYNGNFQKLLGGPKWLHGDAMEKMCVRKYIGVRGMGDFTLVFSHPREVFDADNIIHSHLQPVVWSEHSAYDDYRKFGTIRNPVGILNSSCFSLNPLASEYIQRFLVKDLDETQLREDLAIYKLTDLSFFKGLMDFQENYWDEFVPVAERYHIMRWEDLLEKPDITIQQLAYSCGIDLSQTAALQIWAQMKNHNLTGDHKHNTRPGGGKIGRWKQCLVNEHIEMILGSKLGSYAEHFGYEPLTYLKTSDYTPFQKSISEHIRKGKFFNPTDDEVLFGFAFNKSNITDTVYNFRRYEWRKHTKIERSCFSNQEIEHEVWNVAEDAVEHLNRLFEAILAERYFEFSEAQDSLTIIAHDFDGLFKDEWAECFSNAVERAKQRVSDYFTITKVKNENGGLLLCES